MGYLALPNKQHNQALVASLLAWTSAATRRSRCTCPFFWALYFYAMELWIIKEDLISK